MIGKRRVWVVVPAFEEARLIGVMLRGLPATLSGVLVVDDASTDGTADIVAGFIAEQRTAAAPSVAPPLFLVRHAKNAGVGAAITTGYRAFLLREQAEDAVCVVMGGDNQMDPQDLGPLVHALADGVAYAKGNRFVADEARCNMPGVRWCGNIALTLMTRWASGLWHVTDSQCGYAAISREALMRLPLDELYARYGFPNDLLLHLARQHLRVVDVPVRAVYAGECSKIRLPRVAPRIFWMLFTGWLQRQCRGGVAGKLLLLLFAGSFLLPFIVLFGLAPAGTVLLAVAALLVVLLLDALRESRATCASSH